ncbi:hydroxymethylglutaryl-CoA reductase, degradative [Amycolatopsis rubida]|uniref:3-hydroxy-3-methylglutaryl coenzyme A reductase n=1 Tax=Amycolatopsis rubida TaxID=112413 RepID=A0A1I5TYA8_9PSEU|nr:MULTISPECIES: hydroxymethylglutaryl-CoA reductase, degradative [Amycolatopsis]MYW93622.1 hydroxymethylglutaryl-CoA reductase, degradative [Amycolatopsis rubida]NEC58609.1 hydroxymethylglutaryl-CoA reductase, degradative [Amycolatopsis rubida]OAP22698.1 3-hydroxy-3-methylglutaryl-coenzyme A reductase [Amycolatopsis sp. M39]SFP87276.1 hydroxymethylglutaryl-CoA reductase [Amycolatopsis rubida]
MSRTSRIQGLRDLPVEARRTLAAESAGLDAGRLAAFDPARGITLELADHLIENVVGVLGLPLGVATNFVVNGREVLVPMATEEASVVAAASNSAKLARVHGGFFASSTAPIMQAQVQIVGAADPEAGRIRLLEAREELIELADAQDPRLVEAGGGVRDLSVRVVPSRAGTYVVAHLQVDVRDAMGANAVNTMAEAVAQRAGAIAGGRTLLRILTNKADLRLARARAVFDAETLGGAEVVDDIVHAAALAEADPYRAATHNKGIMNGISAVVLATGNDTRAVEAGAHSHAVSPAGRYTSLSRFEKNGDGDVVGTLELPMPVGLVGGATKVHPVAQAAIALLGVTSAAELAEIIAAVGLAQNFGAVRALATEGIQRGHMSLHARNIASTAGATGDEVGAVVARLVADKKIHAEHAKRVLAELRAGK